MLPVEPKTATFVAGQFMSCRWMGCRENRTRHCKATPNNRQGSFPRAKLRQLRQHPAYNRPAQNTQPPTSNLSTKRVIAAAAETTPGRAAAVGFNATASFPRRPHPSHSTPCNVPFASPVSSVPAINPSPHSGVRPPRSAPVLNTHKTRRSLENARVARSALGRQAPPDGFDLAPWSPCGPGERRHGVGPFGAKAAGQRPRPISKQASPHKNSLSSDQPAGSHESAGPRRGAFPA